MLPVGYLALRRQGIFIAPPTPASLAALIHAVLGRGYTELNPDE